MMNSQVLEELLEDETDLFHYIVKVGNDYLITVNNQLKPFDISIVLSERAMIGENFKMLLEYDCILVHRIEPLARVSIECWPFEPSIEEVTAMVRKLEVASEKSSRLPRQLFFTPSSIAEYQPPDVQDGSAKSVRYLMREVDRFLGYVGLWMVIADEDQLCRCAMAYCRRKLWDFQECDRLVTRENLCQRLQELICRWHQDNSRKLNRNFDRHYTPSAPPALLAKPGPPALLAKPAAPPPPPGSPVLTVPPYLSPPSPDTISDSDFEDVPDTRSDSDFDDVPDTRLH